MVKQTKQIGFILTLLVVAAVYIACNSLFGYSFLQGNNSRNVTIDTTVNITNSLPEVLFVSIESGATNITLNAGTEKLITCNATVRDWNGGSTITNVSATFFYNLTKTSTGVDDNNDHYTNVTCNVSSTYDIYTRNVTCTFPVQYYANNGRWRCNVTAHDPYVGFNESVVNFSTSGFNTTNIDALLALNVTTLIDYGNLSVGDTSDPQQANVTNLGNQNINISVRGYGNYSYLANNVGMYCDIGNISVDSEKFNLIGGTNIANYRNLSHSATQVPGMTMLQQTNDSQQVLNTTYWILFVPPNPFGRCNGTIIFQAERSS